MLIAMSLRPEHDDMVVVRGDPIWHRVEDVFGSKLNLTFGELLKLSGEGRGCYYT